MKRKMRIFPPEIRQVSHVPQMHFITCKSSADALLLSVSARKAGEHFDVGTGSTGGKYTTSRTRGRDRSSRANTVALPPFHTLQISTSTALQDCPARGRRHMKLRHLPLSWRTRLPFSLRTTYPPPSRLQSWYAAQKQLPEKFRYARQKKWWLL